MDEFQWISGLIAVEAVIRANSREVKAVLIDEDRYDGPTARISQMAVRAGIPVSRVPTIQIDQHFPEGARGHVVAQVGPRRYQVLDALLSADRPLVFLLDGVEDPYNFGQAVRSIYAAGVDGLVVPRRNWLSAAATVIRASAGASEFLPTAVAETNEAVASARSHGLRVVVATHANATPMHAADLTGAILMVVGGEKRGVARPVMEAADLRVSIPYGRAFEYSLGTAAAAAVLAFECLSQRHRSP